MGRRRIAAVAVAMATVVVLSGCNRVLQVTANAHDNAGACLRPSLSANGKWLAYSTFGDPSGTTRPQQTILKNLGSGIGQQIAADPSYATPQSVNTDGTRLVFVSPIGSREQVYLWSRGTRTRISPAGEDNPQAVISADGKKVAYSNAAASKMWLYDVATKVRTEIPRPSTAAAGDPFFDLALSSTGRYAVYRAFPDGRFYVRDLVGGGSWSLMSAGETSTGTMTPSISADGRFVTYAKTHPGLLGGSNQVYVWDRITKVTKRVTGLASPKLVGQPAISGDGSRIAYVVNQVGSKGQLVVVRRTDGKVLASLYGSTYIEGPVLSVDGRVTVFCTTSTNLSSDKRGHPNIFTLTS